MFFFFQSSIFINSGSIYALLIRRKSSPFILRAIYRGQDTLCKFSPGYGIERVDMILSPVGVVSRQYPDKEEVELLGVRGIPDEGAGNTTSSS